MRVPVFSVWLGVMSTLLVTGCSSTTSPTAQPTQTPIYIVITSTPTQSAEEATAAAVPTISPTADPSGIPAPFSCRAEVVEQTFERGVMFWVGATTEERCSEEHSFEPGSGEIWVAIYDESGRSGDWLIVLDTWVESETPASDPSLIPPLGLYQPVRGFGNVWRNLLTPGQREAIGWATGQELKFVTDYRYDAGGYVDSSGTYVPRPGTHRLVALNGDEYYFDEVNRTVLYPAGTPFPTQTPVPSPTPPASATPEG